MPKDDAPLSDEQERGREFLEKLVHTKDLDLHAKITGLLVVYGNAVKEELEKQRGLELVGIVPPSPLAAFANMILALHANTPGAPAESAAKWVHVVQLIPECNIAGIFTSQDREVPGQELDKLLAGHECGHRQIDYVDGDTGNIVASDNERTEQLTDERVGVHSYLIT